MVEKLRIAVCLYGQPRTWRSTHQWIKDQYTNDQFDVDYFISVKTFNQSRFYEKVDVSNEELQEVINTFSPVSSMIDETYSYGSNSISLVTVLSLKREYEISNNFTYDAVVLQRFDGVTGPFINWVDKIQWKIPYMTVYVLSSSNMFMQSEGFSNGVDDYLVMGDSAAMDVLAAMKYDVYASTDYIYNSNHTAIYRICMENNIRIVQCPPMGSMLVRKEFETDDYPTEVRRLWGK